MGSSKSGEHKWLNTIITALAVILASVLSAFLTNYFNLQVVKETAKKETQNIILASKYNLEATQRSNKNNLLIARENNQNALRIAEKNAQLQREILLNEAKRARAEKEHATAKLFFNDISVRLEILLKAFESLKRFSSEFEKNPDLSFFASVGGVYITKKLDITTDVPDSQVNLASSIELDSGLQVVKFYNSLRFINRYRALLTKKMLDDFFKNFDALSTKKEKTKEEEILLMRFYFSAMIFHRSEVTLSLINCVKLGNQALISLNKKYIKSKAAQAALEKRKKYVASEIQIHNVINNRLFENYRQLSKKTIAIFQNNLNRNLLGH